MFVQQIHIPNPTGKDPKMNQNILYIIQYEYFAENHMKLSKMNMKIKYLCVFKMSSGSHIISFHCLMMNKKCIKTILNENLRYHLVDSKNLDEKLESCRALQRLLLRNEVLALGYSHAIYYDFIS